MSAKLYAVDTETRLIGRGPDLAPELACTTFCNESFVPGILHAQDGEDFVAYLYDECMIAGGNYAFDACVHMRAYPRLLPNIFKAYRENRVRDVFLAQKLIDLGQGCLGGYRNGHGVFIEHRYSLAALYERYGFGSLDKSADTWRLRYGELIPVPMAEWPDAARDYAKLDALATLKVDAAVHQFSDFLENVYMQTRYALSRQLMSITGMITDAKTCALYLEETKAEIARCKGVIETAGLLRGPNTKPASKIGTRDTAAAKARMISVCAELGIEPKLTPKDGICLDAEATRDTGDPVLKAYSTFTSATTILKKAAEMAEGSKGLPLQTSWDLIKENGRCSSRKPGAPLVGIQMQNMPKNGRMRSCLVARPGKVLVSIDFQAHELVTVSQCEIWMTGKSKLAEALNAKRDVHCDVGATLLECSYEEILANKKQGQYKLARDQSKEVNFGGWAFMQPARLALQMNKKRRESEPLVSLERATVIMHAWEQRWAPQAYFAAIEALFSDGNRWGRTTVKQFLSGRVRGLVDFQAACNTFFSGLAADASQSGDTALTEACYLADEKSPLWQARPLLSIHDEVVIEVLEDRLHDAAFLATKIFLESAQSYTPDVKLFAEPAAMRAYSKEADTVLKDGQLQIWCPQEAA